MKRGDILKWRGLRNSDTGEIDGGYLYILDTIKGDGYTSTGILIQHVRTKKEAIKKYKEKKQNEQTIPIVIPD